MRTPSKKSLPLIATLGVALLISLTACTPAAGEQDSTTPDPTPTQDVRECSGLTGVEALEKWANEVETSTPWDLAGENSDVSGYDECAELSWIVLRPESCCTVFEITPVLFFHRGEFVPGATVSDRAQDRQTEAERLADDAITITFATSGGANKPPVLTTTTYTWDESTQSVIATEAEAAEAVGDTVDGHWCPTPESDDHYGCVTIALPAATYDSGTAIELTEDGDVFGDGGIAYSQPGAPFGTFYRAGTSISLPDYYSGADLPDVDRIWNSQTGVLLVRQ